MTINTQKLRQIGALLDEGYQINDHSGVVTQAADIIETLEGQVAEYARMLEKQGAEADARIDAQTAEIARLRKALLWNAGALQACCSEGIREASNITIAAETKCFAEILDMADAALAQEQGGSDGGQN
ncbi:hypothetical protein ACWKWV_09955 [Castellaniella ginsengisoli]